MKEIEFNKNTKENILNLNKNKMRTIKLNEQGFISDRFQTEQTIAGDLQITNSKINSEMVFNVNGDLTIANCVTLKEMKVNLTGENENKLLRKKIVRLKKKIKGLKAI